MVSGRDKTLSSNYFLMHLRSPKGAQRRGLYFYWKKVCVCMCVRTVAEEGGSWTERDVKDGFTEKVILSLD